MEYAEGKILISEAETLFRHQTLGINVIPFQIPKLSINKSLHLEFTINVSDATLSSGIHHMVTPVRINYKSVLANDEKTSYISQATFVHDVPFIIEGWFIFCHILLVV